ncbi:MAG: hypothetical protein K0R31_115 [Clostridiales bacterium]|nr:hypothetical protein [Clostridiales bacterium]
MGNNVGGRIMNSDSQNEFITDKTVGDKGSGLRKPTIGQIGILYTFVAIIFIILGSKAQQNEFYSGILITEFGIIALPPIILLLVHKFDLRRVLRLNRISFLNVFIIFWIMIFAMPVVGVFNYVNLVLIKQIFGKLIIQPVPISNDAMGLLLNVLVIGGSAGICEEILFRGTIQRGFERLGVVKAILITAFLFGLLHVDFQKLLGTFLLGALIGFIVYRTNSLYGGIFAHFANNSLAVLLTYGVNKAMKLFESSGLDKGQLNNVGDLPSFADIPAAQLIVTIAIYSLYLYSAL